jgi:hypothetical protein
MTQPGLRPEPNKRMTTKDTKYAKEHQRKKRPANGPISYFRTILSMRMVWNSPFVSFASFVVSPLSSCRKVFAAREETGG